MIFEGLLLYIVPSLKVNSIIIIIIIIIYYYFLLQLSCHSVAVVLTLVQTKQIRINIHKLTIQYRIIIITYCN